MKKKLTLLLLAAALVGVGGTAPLVPTLQAATTELKSALNDTKAEIKALKKDIRTLESNVSKATKSLDKSRKSEAKLRQACDAMESKLSAKKTVYQLAEGRIAAGNLRAAEGQAALAAEIKALEEEYTASMEKWEMDKLVANDSHTVIEINQKLISLRKARIKELENRVNVLKSDDAEAEMAKIKAEQALQQSALILESEAQAQKALQETVAEAEKAAPAPAAVAQAEAEKAAQAQAVAQAEAEKAAQAKAKAEAEKVALAQAEAEKAAQAKAKADQEAAAKAKAEADKVAQAQAKAQAEADKEAQAKAKAEAEKEKQLKEARKIAEKEAQNREKNLKQAPAVQTPKAPTDSTLDPKSKEAKLQEILELYRQDKITPRQYQERRAAILAGQE